MTFIADRDLVSFRAELTGAALVEGDPGYDKARSVWNGEIDRRPAVVAVVAGPADIVTALAFARERRLEISVRGGGHNPGGAAVCEGGLAINLSSLDSVAVDPAARTARCGGGATLAQLDAATQEHGLAVPAGTVSHTGVGGLTLGGGFGWLTSKHGLTIDNLISAEIVTADGRVLRASATEEPDLFWALRGGGGNFGVVTEFEFALHPVGPLVDVGFYFWPLDQGTEALKLVRDVIDGLDNGTHAMLVGMNAPPAPFVPAEHQFAPGYALVVAGFGDTDRHARIAQHIRDTVPPLFDFVSPMPYTTLQKLIDDSAPWGSLAYEKALYLDSLTDEVIDVITEYLPLKSSPMSTMPVTVMGGAFADVDDDATAFGGSRRAGLAFGVVALAPAPDLLEVDRAWVRSFWNALLPHATNSGSYVNFMADYEEDRVRAAYGKEKYDRLALIKDVYDPENVFHRNPNIRPTLR
jgi:hypothetical protein